jgi:hypothetical protein
LPFRSLRPPRLRPHHRPCHACSSPTRRTCRSSDALAPATMPWSRAGAPTPGMLSPELDAGLVVAEMAVRRPQRDGAHCCSAGGVIGREARLNPRPSAFGGRWTGWAPTLPPPRGPPATSSPPRTSPRADRRLRRRHHGDRPRHGRPGGALCLVSSDLGLSPYKRAFGLPTAYRQWSRGSTATQAICWLVPNYLRSVLPC